CRGSTTTLLSRGSSRRACLLPSPRYDGPSLLSNLQRAPFSALLSVHLKRGRICWHSFHYDSLQALLAHPVRSCFLPRYSLLIGAPSCIGIFVLAVSSTLGMHLFLL